MSITPKKVLNCTFKFKDDWPNKHGEFHSFAILNVQKVIGFDPSPSHYGWPQKDMVFTMVIIDQLDWNTNKNKPLVTIIDQIVHYGYDYSNDLHWPTFARRHPISKYTYHSGLQGSYKIGPPKKKERLDSSPHEL